MVGDEDERTDLGYGPVGFRFLGGRELRQHWTQRDRLPVIRHAPRPTLSGSDMVNVARKVESGGRGEDNIAVERAERRLLLVVSDGAGGAAGGKAAAQAVCDAAVAAFREGSAVRWSDQLRLVDSAVVRAGHGGSATAIVVEISDGTIMGASVGDSSAWVVTPSGITDLTEHQVVKPLLGTGAAEPVAFGPVAFSGRLLLGTDGLFKYAPRARIATLAMNGTLEIAVQALVDGIRLKSGRLQDDIAVVLCEETG